MKRQQATGIIDGNEVDYFVKGFVHSLDSVGFLQFTISADSGFGSAVPSELNILRAAAARFAVSTFALTQRYVVFA